MMFAYETIFSCKEAFNQQKLKLEDTTDFFPEICFCWIFTAVQLNVDYNL